MHQDNIAMQWGLDTEALGLGELGATLDGDAAMQLPLSDRHHLFNYVRQVLVTTDEALSQVDDAEFQRVISYVGQPESVCYAITDQLKHLSRHLGMIEAMRGIQGLDDTATIQVGEINALPIQPHNRHLLHSEDYDVSFFNVQGQSSCTIRTQVLTYQIGNLTDAILDNVS